MAPHECHDEDCMRHYTGLYIPCVNYTVDELIVGPVTDWNKGTHAKRVIDRDFLKEKAEQFAQWCFTSVDSTYMAAFKNEYNRLKNGKGR